MELIKLGAEAALYRDKDRVIKQRLEKRYRHPELDKFLRRYRTRREAKLLQKLREIGVNTPKLIEVKEEDYTIIMQYVDGVTLKRYLSPEKIDIMEDVGNVVAKIHKAGIIHGDLTTSNFIVKDSEIYVIDLGLGFFSRSVEDRAVDLLSFRRSYIATHPQLYEGWERFLERYVEYMDGDGEDVLKRMEEVAKRARYL